MRIDPEVKLELIKEIIDPYLDVKSGDAAELTAILDCIRVVIDFK